MSDFNKQICRLCLVISPTCECETIDEIKKEILQVLQINIDVDISNYAVACNRCLKRLQDCFDYKSHIITTHMDEIKKTSQREMIGKSLDRFQVCQLCMSFVKDKAFNDTTDMKGAVLLKNMIRYCFPEVDLSSHDHEPLICKQCVSSLERYYEFMKNCEEVEQKIVHFRQESGHCIADKLNLEDMLKFKDYDIPGTPLIIKKECLDAGNVDENATKCSKSEEITSIKCEEIDIKDELDNGDEHSGSFQLDDYNNLGEKGSSKWKGNIGKRDSEEKNHFCPECSYSTKKLHNFKNHIRTHSDNKQHYCILCSFVTDTRLLLQCHMILSHKGATKKYGCPECPYEADRKDYLERHIIKHQDISGVDVHKCLSCPFESKYKETLARHHEHKHQCQESSFSTKRCLVKHDMRHEDSKVANIFKCEQCLFRTKSREDLRKHMRCTHLPKRTYSCNQCTYSGNYLGVLHRHQLVHQADEERQMYKCDLCSYQAKCITNVKVHRMKTHTDPSNLSEFKCAHCPYETVVKSYLRTHMKWRHGNQQFKCEVCEFCTRRKSLLKRHQLTHVELEEAMGYYCATCNFKTKYKNNLKYHVKSCMKRKRTNDADDKKEK